MTCLRALLAGSLALLLAAPLLQPFLRLTDPDAWSWSAADLERAAHLAANTLFLVAGTLALALPLGVLLAFLLFRSDLPLRRPALALVVFSLFVPLPVLVSAWQGMFGADGIAYFPLWGPLEDRPWTTGWLPALWVHVVAGLPWVTLIVGVSLRGIEPELEEEALQTMPPWRVACFVMLPRCWSSLAAAALFLALVTAGEITVTDMMLISTFAEEIHTQFTLGEQAALARTLLLSLPALLIVVLGLAWVGARIERRLPPLPFLLRSHRPLRFEPRAFWSLVSWLLLGVALLPCASLVWKVGLTGQPRIWSPAQAWHQLGAEGRLLGGAVTETLLVALITGGLVAGLALFCCWLAQESRWLRAYLLAMLTTAWVLPGPVVGIGLKELILRCVEALPYGPWSQALYHGPSPLPIVWVSVIRFLPPAVFFLWPVVRTIPVELREAVRLDGAGPFQEWANLVWPLTRRATEVVALAVSALCLGEVAASVRVETPGWESFAKLLFDRMHYGVDANVSALALLLLGSLTALALIGIILIRLFARR